MTALGSTSDAPLNAVNCDAARLRTKRVLTVGDGNFSYSLAFAKRFLWASSSTGSNEQPIELVATSYDSYDELIEKYPESARICSQLREMGVQVLHRVDATNLAVSLENAVHETHDDDDEASSPSSTKPKMFDLIVFNHPHCGEENVKRHQSLLSHFYKSALQILNHASNPQSEIHLTLAVGQPERWEAVARAKRVGLKLKQCVHDVDNHDEYGLVYERKRHQNGKSFHRVLLHGEKVQQESTLFIFRKRCEGEEDVAISSSNTLKPEQSNSNTQVQDTSARVPDKEESSRKRKAQDAALTQHEFACEACEKSFKTAQGLKTHVHMVHELGKGGTTGPVSLPCGFCDRTFRNEDARRQHRLAKHGKDQMIQPDWYQHQQDATNPEEPSSQPSALESLHTNESETTSASRAQQEQELECSICHLVFASQSLFDEHWQNLKPKAAAQRHCDHCGRVFDEIRALRQHQNFCDANGNAETAAAT
ncbi:Zn-finger protein, partial [Globisporangium splendens]